MSKPNSIATPAPPAEAATEMLDLLRRIAAAADSAQTEALDPAGAAKFLDVSVSKLHSMNSAGLIPAPAAVGDSDRLPRWPRSELRAWLLSGAPSRQRWVLIRDAKMKQLGAA